MSRKVPNPVSVPTMKKSLLLCLCIVSSLVHAQEFMDTDLAPAMEWVSIKEDLAFSMGDIWSEGAANQRPVHSVTLSPYDIGKVEVTNAQYACYLNQAHAANLVAYNGNNAVQVKDGTPLLKMNIPGCQIVLTEGEIATPIAGKEKHPVVCVTWYGAQAFAKFYNWRLPTEAQWERAAKGSSPARKWPWGNIAPSCERGNLLGCSSSSTSVGQFEQGKSQEGCYDLAGNVWEWCADWMGAYSEDSKFDPLGPEQGTRKVERGGCWPNESKYCRTTFRGSRRPDQANIYVGFRVQRYDPNGLEHNTSSDQRYPSVQLAINEAISGDMIVIAPGLHNGNLIMTKEVTLTSIDPNDPFYIGGTIIQGDVNHPVLALTDDVHNCTIDGLTLHGGSVGIRGTQTNALLHNCRIMDNVCHGMDLLGSSPSLTHCLITANGGNGIVMQSIPAAPGRGGHPDIPCEPLIENYFIVDSSCCG
ncbi:SUMF1/EgtB/PvdO family nonheme iron enzyme [Planctomycetota bacterium]